MDHLDETYLGFTDPLVDRFAIVVIVLGEIPCVPQRNLCFFSEMLLRFVPTYKSNITNVRWESSAWGQNSGFRGSLDTWKSRKTWILRFRSVCQSAAGVAFSQIEQEYYSDAWGENSEFRGALLRNSEKHEDCGFEVSAKVQQGLAFSRIEQDYYSDASGCVNTLLKH